MSLSIGLSTYWPQCRGFFSKLKSRELCKHLTGTKAEITRSHAMAGKRCSHTACTMPLWLIDTEGTTALSNVVICKTNYLPVQMWQVEIWADTIWSKTSRNPQFCTCLLLLSQHRPCDTEKQVKAPGKKSWNKVILSNQQCGVKSEPH